MRFVALFLILLGCSSSGERRDNTVLPPPEAGALQGDELLDMLTRVGAAGARTDEPALNQLIEYSRHRDYLIRVQAIKALNKSSFSSRPEVFDVYVRALDDDNWLVRSFAVKTLGKDSRPEAKDALRKRLKNEENDRVRGYIEAALR